ncbi:MAG TPA: carboxyl transferase domain-containing protein [Acidimicrobiales bacterium]|nr:carboxyl transferase domain-containing protein [Acidimicrobiales bacterium]
MLTLAAERGGAVDAGLRRIDGRRVAWFRLAGGKHRGAIGTVEGDTMRRVIEAGVDAGVPIIGVIDSSGADVTEGVAALHAWGTVARALATASGQVPVLLAVVGPCVSGPALLLGLADAVVMTTDAFAYVSGPDAVAAFSGMDVDHHRLGGAAIHATRSGVASLVVDDEDAALDALAALLSYVPDNCMTMPDNSEAAAPIASAADVVPATPNASYDVRAVVDGIVDAGSFLELRARFAPNLVTGLARVDGVPVGIVANQPCQLAGTLDIAASQKGAGLVQWCDAFNIPLVTLVDTPGFQPGKDIEWRGMIRHGAQLAHAYAAATVPRVCVILRKAFGGAYIVMDSRPMGSDLCLAWPTAEIAVMGPAGAVNILFRRELAADPTRRVDLEADYELRYCNARMAAERGYVDAIVAPDDTRALIAETLDALAAKREHLPRRRHANIPL